MTEGVRLGVTEISGVAVGVLEGVLVGKVDVGKGPKRAPAVIAIAVLVLATFCGLSRFATNGFPNANMKTTSKMLTPRRICSGTCMEAVRCL